MFDFLERLERNLLKRKEIPQHIAIIMDGNGTWARRRGLPRTAGHARGASALRNTLKEAVRLGVKYLSVYAFSTENWKRPKAEVDYLMQLFMDSLQREVTDLKSNNIQLKFLGKLDAFSKELKESMQKATKETASSKPALTLNVMINYGAREEIIAAVNNISAAGKSIRSEAEFAEYLYTKGVPDPDLLIRTSGQIRVSNFLLWQIAYTEFWFTDICWPDFNGKRLRQGVKVYQRRQRRKGGL
jgi:undecaprenyl diphosphate synthase